MIRTIKGRRFIISADYHISPNTQHQGLQCMAESIRESDTVIILGDLFEFWVENKWYHAQGTTETLKTLKGIAQKASGAHLIVGNRDFLAGKVFERETGFCVHLEPVLLETDDRRCLAIHGDELLVDDVSYQEFKKYIRHPFIRRLSKFVPIQLLELFAKRARKRSIEKLSKIPYDAFRPQAHIIQRFIGLYQPEVIVAGHLHQSKVLGMEEGFIRPLIILSASDQNEIYVLQWSPEGLQPEIPLKSL